MKILIVDDNEDSRMILKKILVADGHTVEMAINGEEALDMAKESPPDMIISDILMPVMDGFTLCRECKGDERLKKIPFIFYTATYTDEKDEELALRMGAERFIRKPVEPDEFMKIIQGVIRDMENGRIIPKKKAVEEDEDIFRLYSERLVNKLEKKMLDLEREMSERKKAEELLRESELRHRSITDDVLDISSVGIFILDSDFQIVWVNQALERYFGLRRKEVIGKDKRQLIRERIKDIFEYPVYFTEKVFATYDDNTYVEHFECHIVPDSEREERWLEHWSQPILSGLYAGGRVEHYSDITERKQVEEALRESEARHRAIFEGVAEGILIAGVETKDIKYANPAICRMLGYTEEEIKNLGVRGIHPKEDHDRVLSEFEVQARGEKTLVSDIPFLCKDGTIMDTEIRTAKTIINGIECRAGCVTDITERKRNEEALRESEEKYRTLFDASKDAIYINTREGSFLDVNQSFLDLFGYTREEMADIKAENIYVNPDDRINFQKEIEEKGFVKDFELKLRKKDGKEMDCLLTSALRRADDGSISGYRGILRDVTEKNKIEAQLRQAQRMESIGTLAGGIAHDFNNLIQAIYGYTQIMMMEKEPGDPDYSRLEAIERVARRAGDLTKQILLFSRKGEINLRPVELNLEVKETCELLERSIPKMISIELHLGEKLKIINADPAQIEQIMMNLGVNARDAMPDSGKLVFETENVILDEEYCKMHLGTTPGEYVVLSVSDTGHGMDRETVEHIFEPFFTTKETGRGTGLGLATVYGIVKSHGGHISCYSEPGQGTTFKIYFPVIEQEREVAREREAEIPVKGGNETILLVDDEEDIRDLGESVLTRFGYTVIMVSDGESALEIYRQEKEKIALVLLDLIMPGMGGSRCLEEILKIDPDARVIIASGYSADGKAKEALESGAVEFIGKPFQLRDMLRKVREVLDK